MNKSELIEAMAKSADISKASAEKALDGALNAITGELKKGSGVTLVGFMRDASYVIYAHPQRLREA